MSYNLEERCGCSKWLSKAMVQGLRLVLTPFALGLDFVMCSEEVCTCAVRLAILPGTGISCGASKLSYLSDSCS